jgi:fluoride ion exporter CrcB/FEX
MVVMLDGTYCDLGSQVVTVLFGYAIGLIGATCGFQFGRQCGHFLHNLKHANEENEEIDNISVDGVDAVEVEEAYKDPRSHSNYGVELVDDDEVKLKPVPNHLHKIPLFLAAAALLVAFVIGDFVQGNQYYRGMTMLWFLSPFGSLLRWRMSVLNTKRKKRLWGIYFVDWVPWGTFFANILAAILSACLTGLNDRYFTTIDPMERNWVQGLIFAINTGFAGSLSTVSTMIKETIILAEQHKGEAKPHYYAIATCGCGMLLGIAVYATTVRINN